MPGYVIRLCFTAAREAAVRLAKSSYNLVIKLCCQQMLMKTYTVKKVYVFSLSDIISTCIEFQVAAKKTKKKQNGIADSEVSTVKSQIKSKKKKMRKKLKKTATQENSKGLTEVSVRH